MPWIVVAAVLVTVAFAVVWTWQCHNARRKLYSNSRTVFAAVLVQLAGLLVLLWDIAGPAFAMPEFRNLIPEEHKWAWPLLLVVLGEVFRRLRKVTTKSLGRRRAEP